MILLDTDVVIDLLRGHPPALSWLAALGAERVTVSGYVAMEAIAGCHDAAELRRTLRELANYDTVWLAPAECEVAADYLKTYRLSHGLGLIDALIARTAVTLNTPLHTFNVKHFQPVPGLTTIQPYAK